MKSSIDNTKKIKVVIVYKIFNHYRKPIFDELNKYKELIDKTPNKFLKFHLKDQIQKEHYELAQYIKETALKRGFDLYGV